jgi:uncharacterized protein with beta-barrel porin domain
VSSIAARGLQTGSSRVRNHLSLLTVGGQYATNLASGGVSGEVVTRFIGSGVGIRSGRFQGLVGATAAWHDVSVSRTVSFPGFGDRTGSRYVASSYRLDAEGSYALLDGPVGLAPYAGYSRIMIKAPAFTETGGITALSFDRENRAVDEFRLGVRARATARLGRIRLTPHLDASVQQAFGDVAGVRVARFVGGGEAFDSIGSGFDRRSLDVDAGLDFAAGPATLGASYRARLGDQWSDQAAVLSATLRF